MKGGKNYRPFPHIKNEIIGRKKQGGASKKIAAPLFCSHSMARQKPLQMKAHARTIIWRADRVSSSLPSALTDTTT